MLQFYQFLYWFLFAEFLFENAPFYKSSIYKRLFHNLFLYFSELLSLFSWFHSVHTFLQFIPSVYKSCGEANIMYYKDIYNHILYKHLIGAFSKIITFFSNFFKDTKNTSKRSSVLTKNFRWHCGFVFHKNIPKFRKMQSFTFRAFFFLVTPTFVNTNTKFS